MLALALLGGLYAAEIVFRSAVAVHSVPRTDRDFERLFAESRARSSLPAEAPGRIRILGLADSFGVAGGAENYHHLLERELRGRGHDVEVINLSVGGYSLEQELQLLQRFGAGQQPDLVLHGFFVGNDFASGSGRSMRFRDIEVGLAPGHGAWLPQNLLLPRWSARWVKAVNESKRQERESERGIERGTFSRETFLRIERVRLSTCRRPTRDAVAWPEVSLLLDHIGRTVEGIGATRVMVVHPDQLQIESSLAAEVMQEYSLDAADYDLDLPQNFLGAYARSRRVSLIDLMPSFRREGSEGGLYRLRDTHYNDAGNRLAAGVIADRLEPILNALAARDQTKRAESRIGTLQQGVLPGGATMIARSVSDGGPPTPNWRPPPASGARCSDRSP
jgi:hypothetical protein